MRPDFTVTPAWREEVYRRLDRDGVHVDRRTWDQGSSVVDRMLEGRIASLAFGDSASFRRGIPRDTQLQSALGLLRGAHSQAEALAHAAAAARRTPAPEAGHTGI